ncbi:hypothetical protein HAX54_053308 [Datura stramonium]|uniref:Cyclin-dependent kinase inhibitor domain-containing protein n=1 Tax=Datura stramonium TaxID=4076 RepID=A0ABS8T156_DATST|nr:hypothetical protein [Datura stramonium]
MGKYMRKSKTRGEVALLEVSNTQSSPLGVRTRAKTLALQRLQKSNSTATGGDGGSYLQLRSRRLEKPSVGLEGKRKKQPLKDPNLPNPVKNQVARTSARVRQLQGQSWNSGSVEGEEKKEEVQPKESQNEINNNSGGEGGVEVEASFGENLLELDGRERTTRESTPCSLIRDPDNIQTPGSSTRRPNSASEANGGVPNAARRNIPTAHEMNDFFSGTEEKQQRQFIEKYNFDPVNDKPLPGRYEWVKLDR